MKAYVFQRAPGGEEQIWEGSIDAAPRPGEFLTVNRDEASWVIDSVEWDFSGRPSVIIYVR